MSKPRAYVEYTPGQPQHEHALAAWQGWAWDGYDVQFLNLDDLSKFVLRSSSGKLISRPWPEHPVAGTVEFTRKFLTVMGAPVPKPLNVPDELLAFAGRPITRLTLEEALLTLEHSEKPTFIKPADAHKLFTGGVVQTPAHVALLFSDVDPQTPVLISPEVSMVTEYRVFVNRNREIVGMRHYQGDPFIKPSKLLVRLMIDSYKSAPCAYALDVAVTATGKTIVVECNDFFALGTYGLDPVVYSRLTAQRWHQLLS